MNMRQADNQAREWTGASYLDGLVIRIDAGRLTIQEAVIQYAQNLGIDEATPGQILALALGGEREEAC
jgi:hypothetical protein